MPPTASSARNRRRRAGLTKQDRAGLVMIAASLAVVILCGALGMTVFREVKQDPKTGCLLDHKPPPAHTVMLMDETDRLSRDELAYAKSLVMNEYYWLPIGGRLTVRNIIADPDQAEDIVVCRMEDGSKVLGIGRNAKKVRQDFQKVAGVRLDELFTALRTAPAQKYSPIAEYLSAAADRPNFGSNIKVRRLVVFSDMAQHSPEFTQYRNSKFSPNKAIREDLKRDFSKVAVRIHYIARRKLSSIQGAGHRKFWESYFRQMDSTDVALGHGLLIGEPEDRETWSDER